MGDTKRGRERKGKQKREQLVEREIAETLVADESPPSLEEDVPEVAVGDLENVSVTRADTDAEGP